jgi:hypothetical protein
VGHQSEVMEILRGWLKEGKKERYFIVKTFINNRNTLLRYLYDINYIVIIAYNKEIHLLICNIPISIRL